MNVSKYPGVRLLGHMVSVCLTSGETPKCFPEWLHDFALAPTIYENSSCGPALTNMVLPVLFIVAILLDTK